MVWKVYSSRWMVSPARTRATSIGHLGGVDAGGEVEVVDAVGVDLDMVGRDVIVVLAEEGRACAEAFA